MTSEVELGERETVEISVAPGLESTAYDSENEWIVVYMGGIFSLEFCRIEIY